MSGMLGRIVSPAIALTLLLSASCAYAENSNVPTKKTRDRASKVMDSLLPGPPEMPSGTDYPDDRSSGNEGCACKAKSRVEKGIVGVVGGVWQLATFWYPEDKDGGGQRAESKCSASEQRF